MLGLYFASQQQWISGVARCKRARGLKPKSPQKKDAIVILLLLSLPFPKPLCPPRLESLLRVLSLLNKLKNDRLSKSKGKIYTWLFQVFQVHLAGKSHRALLTGHTQTFKYFEIEIRVSYKQRISLPLHHQINFSIVKTQYYNMRNPKAKYLAFLQLILVQKRIFTFPTFSNPKFWRIYNDTPWDSSSQLFKLTKLTNACTYCTPRMEEIDSWQL